MDALTAIKSRRSRRKFTDDPIDQNVLKDLVDCGRLAPSGHNKQGRYFLVLTEQEKINGISELTIYGKFMVDKVHACILVFCDEQDALTLVEDGSAATENILIAATAHGLASCWIAGHGMPYAHAVEQSLGAPSTYRLVSIIALGYSGVVNAKMPPKKELDEVIRWNSF